MTYSALVLAGSRGPDCTVAALGGVSHKALLPIAGKPMIERVIATLSAVKSIDKVVVVIETPEVLSDLHSLNVLMDSGYLQTLTAKPSPAQSALHGFEALGGGQSGPVVITTADNCLLTPEILEYFLSSLPVGSDVTAAMAKTDMVLQAYPEARRTRMRFRDGGQGGCNLFAFQSPQAGKIIRFWRQVEENRKSPLTMLRQLGVMTALRYLTNTLTLAQAVEKLGKRTDTKLAVTHMPFAEAAIDVDSPEDFYLAEKILIARDSR
ncbi:NTP transferase domain-containing protein [Tateyamaria pelophila]|uniref:NTP transferase domain-containing protein n=1 Tax=Tateyamaria pelophila TaxID=328415 RepID=UPI001CC05B02|nr:nucleotidyltransferase family protein [Tateyamaria pelophila]